MTYWYGASDDTIVIRGSHRTVAARLPWRSVKAQRLLEDS
jgi:hypothetical protein